MATITAIETQKRHPERVNVHLDGSYAFSLAGILAARLKVGSRLEPQDVSLLLSDDACEQAYQLALHFLSFRPRSQAELRQYLHKRKIPEDVIGPTLLRLQGNRAAGDEQFAQAWVENRNVFRPRGRRLLAWELGRKGVSAQASEAALADLDESSLAYQAASKRAQRLSALDWPEFRSKLSAFLARRGFPGSIIVDVVSRVWTEIRAGQPISENKDLP